MADQDLADSIDLGTDDPNQDVLPPIEKKYQAQMRQIVTQKLDLPVSALLAMLKDQIQLKSRFALIWGSASSRRQAIGQTMRSA